MKIFMTIIKQFITMLHMQSLLYSSDFNSEDGGEGVEDEDEEGLIV
jgi:hypothetical protein